jgi:DNA polymerase-1
MSSVEQSLPLRDETRPLRELFKRCGFRTWLRELDDAATPPDASGRRAVSAFNGSASDALPDVAAPDAPMVEPVYEMVADPAVLQAWIARIGAAELVSVDTETTSLDPMSAQIVGISLSTEPGHGCYIPLAHAYAGVPEQLERDAVLAALRPWLEDPAALKVGQNLKYDAHVFENHGIRLAGIAHDTLLQSYVLEAHRNHDMDSLASRHLNRRTITYDEVTGKGAANRLRSGLARAGHALRRRRRRSDPASAPHAVAQGAGRAGAAPCLRSHRDAGVAGAPAHGAHRRADRRTAARNPVRRNRPQADGARGPGP